jgi:hypothetical protein
MRAAQARGFSDRAGIFIPVCAEKEFSYNSPQSRKSRIIFYLGVLMGMDIIDRKLLELLQEDATMPIAELAQV